MSVMPVSVLSDDSSGNVTSYTTDSFGLLAGHVYVLTVHASRDAGALGEFSVTQTGVTWNGLGQDGEVGVTFGGDNSRLAAFKCQPASDVAAAPLVITAAGGETFTSAVWQVTQFGDNSFQDSANNGDLAIKDYTYNTSAFDSPSDSLDVAVDATDLHDFQFGAVAVRANIAITPRSGWIGLEDHGATSRAIRLETQYGRSDTHASGSWTGDQNCAIFGLVIEMRPGPIIVQKATDSDSSGSSVSATFPFAIDGGTVLIGIASASNGNTVTFPNVFPDEWTTITPEFPVVATTEPQITIAYKEATGQETELVTATGTSNTTREIVLYEVKNVAIPGWLQDAVSASSGASTVTSLSTGATSALTVSNALAIAALRVSSSGGSSVQSNTWTNGFIREDLVNSRLGVATKYITTLDPVSTTESWASARRAVAGLIVMFDIESGSVVSGAPTIEFIPHDPRLLRISTGVATDLILHDAEASTTGGGGGGSNAGFGGFTSGSFLPIVGAGDGSGSGSVGAAYPANDLYPDTILYPEEPTVDIPFPGTDQYPSTTAYPGSS